MYSGWNVCWGRKSIGRVYSYFVYRKCNHHHYRNKYVFCALPNSESEKPIVSFTSANVCVCVCERSAKNLELLIRLIIVRVGSAGSWWHRINLCIHKRQCSIPSSRCVFILIISAKRNYFMCKSFSWRLRFSLYVAVNGEIRFGNHNSLAIGTVNFGVLIATRYAGIMYTWMYVCVCRCGLCAHDKRLRH